MDTITATNQCLRAELLCWVSDTGNPSSSAISLYPRYLYRDGVFSKISPAAFPDRGAFSAMLSPANKTAQDIVDEFGQLVVAYIDCDVPTPNNFYSEEPGSRFSERFVALYAPNRRHTDLKLERLEESELSSGLVQIVESEEALTFFEPVEHPIRIRTSIVNLFCTDILLKVSTPKTTCYYGPFLYTAYPDGSVSLQASENRDYRIYRLGDIPEERLLTVSTDSGFSDRELCSFVPRDALERIIKESGEEDTFDWLPMAKLEELFRKIINASERIKGIGGRTTLNTLKNAIAEFAENSVRPPYLDERRKERFSGLVSDLESLLDLPEDVISHAFDYIDDGRIAEAMTDKRVFPLVEDRLLASSGIREKLEQRTSELNEQEEDALRRKAAAEQKAQEAERACAEAVARMKEAQESAEKVRAEALEKDRAELEALRQEKEQLRLETEEAKDEYERAIVDRDKVQKSINGIISSLNDEVATSSKILESELLRKVVQSVSGVDIGAEGKDGESLTFAIREDEDELDDQMLLDEIAERIVTFGGRDLDVRDVANLMVCLMQGYITTFAGQPGTGKTSLANILAGALGLKSGDELHQRFCEVGVENGWASYKDYVGYYNPITHANEKTDARTYDALATLSAEGDSGGEPPYIILLDEANLSPIEHYWAPFLRACDDFMTKRMGLALGGDQVLSISKHLRFLATVNFDHTTEALSPRFLDRSWVIALPALDITEEGGTPNPEAFGELAPYSYDRLMRAFGPVNGTSLDQQIESLYKTMLDTCRRHGLPVSQRSQIMMRRYILTASGLMRIQLAGNQYAPLDYAFSQKVLPMIAGPSETIGPFVDELLESCQKLEICRGHLERMKKYGEDNGFYQYFV